jgi:inhibitor of KinA
MEWRVYGPDAVLLRFADSVGDEAFERSRALVAELERHPPPDLLDFAPAFTTLLMEFDPAAGLDLSAVMPDILKRLEKAATQPLPPAKLHEISVSYNGPDLEQVAAAHQLTTTEVVRLHAEPIYNVYFLGFAPGFPYLGDLDRRLHTPRLPSPRPHVPAGSVAIGGEHTGIYSVETPGGWNIIGHTSVALFDSSPHPSPIPCRPGAPTRPRALTPRDDSAMFLLRPGDRVKFIPQ